MDDRQYPVENVSVGAAYLSIISAGVATWHRNLRVSFLRAKRKNRQHDPCRDRVTWGATKYGFEARMYPQVGNMADTEIISAQQEEAARQKGEAAARFNEFISQWDTENIPACNEGMALLLEFADSHPNAYRLAQQRGFTEMTHPMFRTLAKWKAYADHVSACPKCNEV